MKHALTIAAALLIGAPMPAIAELKWPELPRFAAAAPETVSKVWVKALERTSVIDLAERLEMESARLAQLNGLSALDHFEAKQWVVIPKPFESSLAAVASVDADSIQSSRPESLADDNLAAKLKRLAKQVSESTLPPVHDRRSLLSLPPGYGQLRSPQVRNPAEQLGFEPTPEGFARYLSAKPFKSKSGRVERGEFTGFSGCTMAYENPDYTHNGLPVDYFERTRTRFRKVEVSGSFLKKYGDKPVRFFCDGGYVTVVSPLGKKVCSLKSSATWISDHYKLWRHAIYTMSLQVKFDDKYTLYKKGRQVINFDECVWKQPVVVNGSGSNPLPQNGSTPVKPVLGEAMSDTPFEWRTK